MSTLLCDGNNLLMRSVMAMSHAGLSYDGVATGPLLAFINGLSMHLRQEQPTRAVVCWDSRAHRWREDLDGGYKANRHLVPEEEFKESSFALAKQFLALANIAQTEVPGAEADDVIAAYWRCRQPLHGTMVILSSDKDFLQLLDERTEQVRLSSAGASTDRWTAQRVREAYGCGPEHLAKVMAIAGDVSDNVVGVHGIGPKKAVKALAAADWDLDRVEAPRIVAEMGKVRTNLDLVDLRKPRDWISVGDVPAFRPTTPGSQLHELLVEFLASYHMYRVLGRYNSQELWA